ncbi:MAG: proline racemase family protein [Beijerinckiaceae bacterium]
MAATILSFTDMHMAGEPVRIVTDGYPELAGATILDKRREARERHDHLRRAMMLEPRGHAGMYGVIPVAPARPEAAIGVLFTHHEGYSTMCGHATIALGRWIVDEGIVEKVEPVTCFAIEAPCGLLRLSVAVAPDETRDVSFESVPAFVEAVNFAIDVPGFGRILTDIAYGGAYYAILPASRFGLNFFKAPVEQLVAAAGALTDQLRATRPLRHPDADDLGFYYGTVLTDDAAANGESYNLCVFGERQIDRSPTGSGVTARMALDHAKGLVRAGDRRVFRGVSGEPMTGMVLRKTDYAKPGAVIVAVGGRAYYSGKGEFIIEGDDRLGHGFDLPPRFADVAR